MHKDVCPHKTISVDNARLLATLAPDYLSEYIVDRNSPYHIPLLCFVVLGSLAAVYVRPEMQAKAFLYIGGATVLWILLIILGRMVEFWETHTPCPKCGEKRHNFIRRVPSGFQNDGSITNPITLEFDKHRNMYVRRYNRICRSCRHQYYVDEGRWGKGAVQGERKLVMTTEQRDMFTRQIQENRSRTRKR